MNTPTLKPKLLLSKAIIIFCSAAFLFQQSARAQTSVWTGTAGDQLWSDNGNWSAGVPDGSGQIADLSQIDITASTTIHLDTPVTIGSLIFGNTDATPASNWILDANGDEADNVLTLAGGSSAITVNNMGAGIVVVTNVIAGTSGFIKDGIGTLEIDSACTYTGGASIKNGTLALGVSGASGTDTSSPWILGDAAGGSASLLINIGGGNLSNPIQLATGAVGTLTIGNYGNSKPGFAGNINLNNNDLTVVNNSSANARKLLLLGAITNAGNVTFINNGGGNSTIQAGSINNVGTVTVQGTCPNTSSAFLSFGFGPGVSVINYAGPALWTTFTVPANPNGVTINSTSASSMGTITLGTPNGANFLTNVTLNANSSGNIGISSIDYRFQGALVNSGTGTGATVISAGIFNNNGMTAMIQNSATSPLILSGANYYTVPTLVSNGTLLVNGPGSAGQIGSPITVYSGGTMGGTGVNGSLVTVEAGGTLAPGTNKPTAVGTLTLDSSGGRKGALSLNGNLFFKLSKNGATLTNDFVKGTTLLTNLGTGTLTLTNIGSTAIANGDKFTLFSSPLIGGNTLTIVSSIGVFTNDLSVDGSIIAGNPAPIISNLSPPAGTTSGGTTVNIYGSGFASAAIVSFGVTPATSVTFVNSTNLIATAPAHAAGAVTVTVTNPDSQSGTGTYTYVTIAPPVISSISPTNGPTAGGTLIMINGSNFIDGDTVQFGAGSPIAATFASSSQLTITTPAHAAGSVDVTVSDPNNQTYTVADGFVFVAPAPSVWVAPNGGGDGLWTGDTSNWSNNIVANGVDKTADFSQGDFMGEQTVHLDGSVTVGNMIFGTTDTGSPVDWEVDNNGGSIPDNVLTLVTADGTPTITVSDPLALGNDAVITAAITGNQGLALTGGGELTLGTADGTVTNTFTGGISILNGTLLINDFANDANPTDAVTLGSTNAGSFAKLLLGSAHFPNPIVLAPGAPGAITISGDPDSGGYAAITGPAIALNGDNLTFIAPAGTFGNTYLLNGVTGSGNLTLINDGNYMLLNSGTLDNGGSITLQGDGGLGNFNLGILGTNVTALNYTSSVPVAEGVTINGNGITINSGSSLNLPSTGGLTLGSGGHGLTLNANSSGNITINSVDYRFIGNIINSGTGTGITTISAGIFGNSSISSIIQDSATSPLILSAANYYTVPTVVSNGTLLINGPITPGQKGSPVTVYNGGTLGGVGAIGNLVTIQSGGTLAPGTNDNMTIGTLTITNGSGLAGALSLAGNLFFKVNNAGVQSNDFVTGTMLLTNIGTGTLTVSNIGPPLNQGDTFQLFSQPLINGGALTIIPANTFINHLAIDGTIVVGSGTPPPPPATLVNMAQSGSNLNLVWNGGTNQNCILLTSTNIMLPLENWIPIATNMVEADGISTNVIPINAGESKRFYLLEIPSN